MNNTYNKTNNATIEYYTLDQAREILREEARQKRLARQRRYAEKKERFLYFLRQKLIGIAMIILSILIPIVCDGDATASLITFPLGLYLLFTREDVIYK